MDGNKTQEYAATTEPPNLDHGPLSNFNRRNHSFNIGSGNQGILRELISQSSREKLAQEAEGWTSPTLKEDPAMFPARSLNNLYTLNKRMRNRRGVKMGQPKVKVRYHDAGSQSFLQSK